MSPTQLSSTPHLQRTLGPFMLWGLGVGYVISGMYFGWNLGLEKGGTLGLGIATLFIMLMYVTFTFSYAELACAIPKAGGVFDYAMRALGRDWGFIGGLAQNIEFIFAPPAIAIAIGSYLHLFMPQIPILGIAFGAYLLFTSLNVFGVKLAATFELIITFIAVLELLIFAGVTIPAFQWQNFTENAWPFGWAGVFASIPFAIWFFLAIEGVANVAEETINPQKNVLIGFGSALLTLIILCFLTFLGAVGIAGWEAVVYPSPGGQPSDSPLPLAVGHLLGQNHLLYTLVTSVGLFGLIASFHGIILASGRATFEFGRIGFAPPFVGQVHQRFRTPANALWLNMFIGLIALVTGKTGEIITIACFGALTLYIIATVSLLVLRRREPDLPRPFKVPLYPWFPLTALIIAGISLAAMIVFYPWLAGIYFLILGGNYFIFRILFKNSPPAQNS